MIELIESADYSAQFPGRRLARVVIETEGGVILTSDPTEPSWDAASPPSDRELREKFRWLVSHLLSEARAARLERLAWRCDELADVTELAADLAAPPSSTAESVATSESLPYP
jgi:hypothetical protein